MQNWFSEQLIIWYHKNKRDLPWRKENDPYKIWISEIILQQTQVIQGLSYYLKIIEKYPTIKELAFADEDAVLKMWQGLGYYSRARNLHETAKKITADFDGIFPNTYEKIRLLKGIGDYTAAAIASFSYNLPYAVLDGNVYRVLSRLFAIKTPIDSSQGKKEFQLSANELLNQKNPAIHNQAIMEFGSQYCKPVNPDCNGCIFNSKCLAHVFKKVNEFPIKSKKNKIKNRFLYYFVIIDKYGDVWINKRRNNDIWKGLYEFFLIETKESCSNEIVFNLDELKLVCKSKYSIVHFSRLYKHVLTHQKLHAKFYVIKIDRKLNKNEKKINLDEIKTLAFPKLIENFLDDCDLKEIF